MSELKSVKVTKVWSYQCQNLIKVMITISTPMIMVND